MPEQRATVGEVAERAGVSVASVSRALNGLPASPQMLARVQRAAAELGYRPNAMARSLKVRRSHQLALAVADVGNPVYVEMMRAVEDETRARGFRLLVSSTGGRTDDLLEMLASLEEGYADGLILSPLRVQPALVAALLAVRSPVVVIGSVPDDVPLDVVRADSAAGVGLALTHLHEQGARRVALVNGPTDTVPGATRLRGYRRAVADLGLDTDPGLVVEAGDFTLAEGRKAAGSLLDGLDGAPDAVLGGNDLLAIATMHVLTDRGFSVPGDVAVAGLDDTELAEVTNPGLTSVDLGAHERGRVAAQLLLERLDEPDLQPRRVTVRPQLVVRGSTSTSTVPSTAAEGDPAWQR